MRTRIGIAGVTLAACMGTAAGQGAGIPAALGEWQKVNVPEELVWHDPDWDHDGFGWGPGGILATDRSGRLYVANGPRLHVGQPGGASWKTLNKPSGMPPFVSKRPLGAGAESTALWGEWFTQDGGATWDTLSRPGGSFASAVCTDGSLLISMSLDGIERSVPPWRTWDWVHRGETFGHIKSFHQSENGSLLAWPLSAELLLSTDDGKTWKEAVKATANQGPKPGGADIRALDFEGASNASVLMVVRKSTGSDENLLVTLNTLTGKTDTLKAVLPDVPATGIQMAKDGTIWIAFRGKGIYVSLDHGRTFAAHNLGMGSRYPEALEMTSDGTLYAFTRAGLYRLQASSSIDPRGPALRRPGSGNRYGLRLGGLPDALQPHPSNAPIRIQADGRLLITPTPAP